MRRVRSHGDGLRIISIGVSEGMLDSDDQFGCDV